ncbi:MAG TPA: DUF1592 domain-containing protein [Polyangiales bacterium]
MFLRLARFPNRTFLHALAATSLLVSACSGEITGPGGGFSLESNNENAGNGPKANPGTDPSTDHPAGVGDPGSPNGVGWSTRFPKLSNVQWEKSVQQLFYLTDVTGQSDSLVAERADKLYDTISAAQDTISGDAWGRYQTAAENMAEAIVGDSAKLAKITPSGTFADNAAKGSAFIKAFGRRAYRRALTSDEQATYLALFNAGASLIGSGDAFKDGVQVVLEAMLQSPFFLYRVEQSEKANSERKVVLSGSEVATRLSFALWGAMPSDELFAAADAGELDKKEGVAKWAGKLLDDPKAKDALIGFHEQTFQVSQYGTQDKDSSLGFNAEALTPALRQEARMFFEDVVIAQQGGIADLLTQPVAYVNQSTAKFYGITGVTGDALQKRELDGETRAGLLTQLGFLSKNATRAGSDPVHRGLLIVRKVLCDEPDPPPMMFSLPQAEAGLTTREVYEKATACGKGCHDTLINPPGFAFEGFDAIGQVRSMDNAKPVDATGSLTIRQGYTAAEKKKNPSSQLVFDGAVDLVTQLAALPRVHECYARNWMAYMLARDLDPAEKGAWEALAQTSHDSTSARALITRLVQLDAFRTRVADGT